MENLGETLRVVVEQIGRIVLGGLVTVLMVTVAMMLLPRKK